MPFNPRNIMGDLLEVRRQADGTHLAQIDVEEWTLEDIKDAVDFLLQHPTLKIKSIHGSGISIDNPSKYERQPTLISNDPWSKSFDPYPDMLFIQFWKL